MAIYVSGSLAFDRIMLLPGRFEDHILPEKLHILSVSFLIDSIVEKRGGTAGNIAYSLSLLGEQAVILSQAGKDFHNYAQELVRLGLSLEGVREMKEELTAGAYIITDNGGNQLNAFCPAAMKHSCNYDFPGTLGSSDIAIVGAGNMDDMYSLPLRYKEAQTPYIFDPGQQIPALSKETLLSSLTGSYMLICNDYEIELICTALSCDKDYLLSLTGSIITTLGEQGCLVERQGAEPVHVPAVAVPKAVEPTGCGDAFRAGLVWGLRRGRDLADCAKLGSTAASFCVEHYGTQEHYYTMEQFMERHEAAFAK